MEELQKRRSDTAARISSLRKELGSAEKALKGKACVYATGSFGRGEAGAHSDLDLFIVGKVESGGEDTKEPRRSLSPLDEICVKAKLIEVTRDAGIPDFDGDGKYLEHYTVKDFTETLGTQKDDSTNALSARLLLLLESQSLLEPSVYTDAIRDVIDAYWGDYEDHITEFAPGFLVNDILRLWRTFCVNYEARTRQATTPKQKAKRKVKNYKLAHSRMLTCYSALLFLLATFRREQSVSRDHAIEMTTMTPTARLEWLLEQDMLKEAHDQIRALLLRYNRFLQVTSVSEKDLASRVGNKKVWKEMKADAYAFGDAMAAVLEKVGGGSRLYRLVVV